MDKDLSEDLIASCKEAIECQKGNLQLTHKFLIAGEIKQTSYLHGFYFSRISSKNAFSNMTRQTSCNYT